MANELSLTIVMEYLKGARSLTTIGKGFTGILRDVTGADFNWRSQVIGNSTAELLEKGEIGTPGYIAIKNIEGTNTSNYVTIRNGLSGADVVKLMNGDIALFRLATSTPYAISDGNSCEVIYAVIEA